MNPNIAQSDRESILKKHHDFLELALVPPEQLEWFHPDLLEDLLDSYPNPIHFRQRITDYKFERYLDRVLGYDSVARSLARFFYEDYPELFMPKNAAGTIKMIKRQVKRAEKEDLLTAFTSYITGNYKFSKYKKLKELIEEELEQEFENVPNDRLVISTREFAQIMFKHYEQKVETIFKKYGFSYSTELIYGEEKEIRLDGKLRTLIRQVYEEVKF